MSKAHGIWDGQQRMITGLLNDKDIDLFFIELDKVNSIHQWHSEEEDLEISAAPIISLTDALEELSNIYGRS